MDEFKRTTFKDVAIGGIRCSCCCDYNHKRRSNRLQTANFRRITRHRLKNNDRIEFKKYMGLN